MLDQGGDPLGGAGPVCLLLTCPAAVQRVRAATSDAPTTNQTVHHSFQTLAITLGLEVAFCNGMWLPAGPRSGCGLLVADIVNTTAAPRRQGPS